MVTVSNRTLASPSPQTTLFSRSRKTPLPPRAARACSHTDSPQFVEYRASNGDLVRELTRSFCLCQVRTPCFFDDGLERFLHIFRHPDLVRPPLEVKAQHRDPPLVYGIGIYVAIGFVIGYHLTAAREAD